MAVALKGAACPAAWELDGNAGTVAGISFLGTTDNQPLELRSNNVAVARFRSLGTGTGASASVALGSPSNSAVPGAEGSTIAGGSNNTVNVAHGVIGGGEFNRVGDDVSNPSSSPWGAIGGGINNIVTGTGGFVGGGNSNQAAGALANVERGNQNRASGQVASIGGGSDNAASGNVSTLAGGGGNRAQGTHASIGGGNLNVASGLGSVVPGGTGNCAWADLSWAGGNRAKVRPGTSAGDTPCVAASATAAGDRGTFIWADSQSLDFVSSGEDQFLVRARGGVGINAPPIADAVELSIIADTDDSDFANLFLRQRTNSAGLLMSVGGASSTNANDAGFFIDHFNGAGGQSRRLALNGDGSVLIRSNITAANTGVSMAAGSGAWSALSDRHVKTAIVAVDPAAVLDRLLAMPISEWSYIAQGEGIRHLGPMAQDFAAAFGLGENATTISSIDADGVALAAIQGLNGKLERENAALRDRLDALSEEVAALRAAIGQ